jgi:hypothetical protein
MQPPLHTLATSDRSFTVCGTGRRISSVSLLDVQWPSKNLGAVRTCNGAVGRVLTAATMTWQLGGVAHSLGRLLVLASCIMITVGLHDIRPDPKRPAPSLTRLLLQPEENNFCECKYIIGRYQAARISMYIISLAR